LKSGGRAGANLSNTSNLRSQLDAHKASTEKQMRSAEQLFMSDSTHAKKQKAAKQQKQDE